MSETAKDFLVAVLVALVAAVVVGLVFNVVDAIDEYAAEAGVITFLVALLLAALNGRDRR